MLFELTNNPKILELINRRENQVLIHSIIYYNLNENIIDDSTWSKWAMELVELMRDYPNEFANSYHYAMFKNFDGSTGFDIANKASNNAVSKAMYLLRGHK